MRTSAGILLIALSLAACLCTGAAAPEKQKSVAITTGFAGYFRHGHFTPVMLRIDSGPAPLTGRIVLSSEAVCLERPVSVPAGSAREYFLVVPQSLDPIAELGLAGAAHQVYEPKAVAPSARLVAVLGAAPPTFAALQRLLPDGSHVAQIDAAELPEDFRGYEPLDLLVIVDLATSPRDEQRRAMTEWLNSGGRMMVALPAGGADSVSAFWRRFFPAERLRSPGKTEGRDLADSLKAAGLDVFSDGRHRGLAGFRVGLGGVLLADSDQSYADGDEAAAATLKLLELDQPVRRAANPLLSPAVYELFPAAQWPTGSRTALWLAALGYLAAMSVTLVVLRAERKAVFGISAAAFTAAFAAIIYLALVPKSAVALQSASIVHTRSGASALAVSRYIGFGSPDAGEHAIRIELAAPAKPLFYSDVMLSSGPVDVRSLDGALAYRSATGSGKPTCFEQTGVLSFQGGVCLTESAPGQFVISNNARSFGSGDPIDFTDLILTDGTDGVYIESLPCGKSVTVDFAPERRAGLNRILWDHFASSQPFRYRMLRYWMDVTPPGGMCLLGWNRLQVMPPIKGEFLSRLDHETLWEVRLHNGTPAGL